MTKPSLTAALPERRKIKSTNRKMTSTSKLKRRHEDDGDSTTSDIHKRLGLSGNGVLIVFFFCMNFKYHGLYVLSYHKLCGLAAPMSECNLRPCPIFAKLCCHERTLLKCIRNTSTTKQV